LIAANWKMNKTIAETQDFVSEFLPLVAGVEDVEVLVCPPFTALSALSLALKDSRVRIGAQDIFWEGRGAFTGEISADMLLDLNCRYVIVGHSERRHIMGENDLIINRKLKATGLAGLTPIFCVGETLQERENNMARDVVGGQLEKGLQDIPAGALVIAYEPVWAIGTGVNASPEDAREMTGFIRDCLGKLYDRHWASGVQILYGGSVNPANISAFMAQEYIDGALVGGASLNPLDFAGIVRFKSNV